MQYPRIIGLVGGLALAAGCATGETIDTTGVGAAFDAGSSSGGAITASGGATGVAGSAIGGGGASGSGTGGVSAGGSSGSGGGSAGTDAGSVAAGGAAGDSGAPLCIDPAQKGCSGACAIPNPQIGCGRTGCAACPTVTNGYPLCSSGSCDFDCNVGFDRMGSGCTPSAVDGGAPGCGDNIRNGSETDVDCGGGACLKCGDGKRCSGGGDCASAVCKGTLSKTCQTASCGDGVKNAAETDVDCGGNCGKTCIPGKLCKADGDCSKGPCTTSGVCGCTAYTCADVGNRCGQVSDNCGSTITCGCAASQVCNAGACQAPTCTDKMKDGTETGVDCGSTCPSKCPNGDGCTVDADCQIGNCVGNVCAAATCTDKVKNGTETGVDCGSSCPGKCPDGAGCSVNSDCQIANCVAKICTAPICATNSQKDGTETDVDCGGGCPKCTVGKSCGADADCASTLCSGGACACFPPLLPPSVNVDATQWTFHTSPSWACNAAGTTTIDSAAGTVTSTSCALGTLDVTNDAPQLDATGPHVMVVRLTGLTVSNNHLLKLKGDKPVVLLVAGNVLVDTGGRIDAGAAGAAAGPGGSLASQCGGQTGGNGRVASGGADDSGGAGGGAFGSAGGPGGQGNNKANGTSGGAGAASTDTDLVPLRGGCAGGIGGGSSNSAGGAGGGAFEISAAGTITIGTGTNAASLIANGGGGGAQPNNSGCVGDGGDGGGSGGGVLLASPAPATFGTNGAARVHGGGGGGGTECLSSKAGQDGHPTDNTAASGGTGEGANGGKGGLCAGASCSTSAVGTAGGNSPFGGSGGGGGGGRVLVITAAANAPICN